VYRSRGFRMSDFVNAKQYTQGGYTRSDLSTNWTSANDKLTVQAYIHNIEDKLQAESYTPPTVVSVADGATAAVSEPHLMGIRVGIKY
jgi:hypothetical protein